MPKNGYFSSRVMLTWELQWIKTLQIKVFVRIDKNRSGHKDQNKPQDHPKKSHVEDRRIQPDRKL